MFNAYLVIKRDLNNNPNFKGCLIEHIVVNDEYKIAVEKCLGGALL